MPDMTTARALPLDRDRQVSPQIYERIRESIIKMELPPASLLSRTALMDQYNVSQTPIRDALMRLAEEQLVDIFAQHATKVSSIDLRHAREAHFLRRSVEIEVVQSLSLAQEKSFVEILEADLDRQRSMLASGNLAPYVEGSLNFHKTLCDVAGVSELWKLIRSRSGHIDRIRRMDPPDPATNIAEHIEILAAIREGQSVEAQHLMRAHIGRAFANLEVIQERWPEYFQHR